MLFNSLTFLIFFPLVCLLYWMLPNKFRNYFLLVASYYFYMNWEPVYALLIFFSTVTTWFCSTEMDNVCEDKIHIKKLYLTICLVINFSILFVFKYLNFATESIFEFLSICGLRMNVPYFNLLLPVGISFYTFQAVGYTIDVYRKDIKPETNLITYALFVSFFPQLVAGPIERAKNLLPQFNLKHIFNEDMFIDGLKMMIWGFFMKLCIAENVAPYVNAVFNNILNHNGISIWLASFFFTFQIFCDFGGYSLIALGTAKCLGFKLMNNFNHPYLAYSVQDFWRRWHISLSTWFMDYVYIPLGGSRCSIAKHERNIFYTMLISGIWHGANWTFIIWGIYHGILQIFNSLKKEITKNFNLKEHIFPKFINRIIVFFFILIGWVFFRANNISDAFLALYKMFNQPGILYNGEGKPSILMALMLICLLMYKEFKDEFKWNHNYMHNSNKYISVLSTSLMIIIILLCARFKSGQFIYFQF